MSTYGARMFDAIRVVFSGFTNVRFQPEQQPLEKEAIGVLTNPIARTFYSEARDVTLQMQNMLKEHDDSGVVDSVTCNAVEAKLKELQMLQDLHSRLFWSGVYSQFPRGVGFGIRDGWKVVALGDACQPTFDPESPALTFFEDVHKAFLATNDTVFGDMDQYTEPVTQESEEFILGQVTVPALKALFVVKVQLIQEFDEVERETMSISDKSSPDTVKILVMKYSLLSQQIDLVDYLFWLGIQKQFPTVAGGSNFAVRRGWQIVRIPKDVGPDPYVFAALDVLHRCRYEY